MRPPFFLQGRFHKNSSPRILFRNLQKPRSFGCWLMNPHYPAFWDYFCHRARIQRSHWQMNVCSKRPPMYLGVKGDVGSKTTSHLDNQVIFFFKARVGFNKSFIVAKIYSIFRIKQNLFFTRFRNQRPLLWLKSYWGSNSSLHFWHRIASPLSDIFSENGAIISCQSCKFGEGLDLMC